MAKQPYENRTTNKIRDVTFSIGFIHEFILKLSSSIPCHHLNVIFQQHKIDAIVL
jgi:hypothetical protein